MSPLRLVAALVPWAALLSPARADDPVAPRKLSGGELVRLGRSASALVLKESTSGSAFCVHPDGLFVTNHHVIHSSFLTVVKNPDGTNGLGLPPIRLVLNPNRAGQKVVPARVLWSDPSWDLALLRAEGIEGFPSLEIAGDQDLKVLDEVVAFGFPLGTALAAEGESYPAANVTKGKARAVVIEAGEPTRIETDVTINPGNSGGPLLDARGRVVGVIYAIALKKGEKAWTSLSVPVNRLGWFLSRPEIAFKAPAVLRAEKAKPAEFRAVVSTMFPVRDVLEVDLVLGAPDRGERRVPMTLARGAYWADAVPFHGAEEPPLLRLYVERNAMTDAAWVADRDLVIDDRHDGKTWRLRLSEARELSLFSRASPSVHLRDSVKEDPSTIRTVYSGKIIGLDTLLKEVGAQIPNLDPKHITAIKVGSDKGADTTLATVEVRRAGRLVARSSRIVFTVNAGRASLRAVSEGRFVEPWRSEDPVNSFRYHIPAGDPAAKSIDAEQDTAYRKTVSADATDTPTTPGETFKTVPKEYTFSRSGDASRGLRCGLVIRDVGPALMGIYFTAPVNQPVQPGEYVVESRPLGHNGDGWMVKLQPLVSPKDKLVHDDLYSARIRVWENGGFVGGTAIDFVLYRKADGKAVPSISGMLRVNSPFRVRARGCRGIVASGCG